ncbi:AlpA family transcriptional regulator [Citrobacter sp. Marseille-Q3906]|uniref:helix-turn-helix transcriptional regulator n=1 Tax=Citrobacter sp. Marseille-Q3906 TaxID=2866574 RepID=UPI001CE48778|nr:helix-turn-helix domain-containing protein [Citrobacter sp. Marseille-Q3906]
MLDNKSVLPDLMSDMLVDMVFLTTLLKVSDKWIYQLVKNKRFPAPIKLGRCSRWRKSEVEAWLQEKIDASGRG